jgi:hypothetical protein
MLENNGRRQMITIPDQWQEIFDYLLALPLTDGTYCTERERSAVLFMSLDDIRAGKIPLMFRMNWHILKDTKWAVPLMAEVLGAKDAE